MTPHAARGIANDFPTLRALFESYANCETQSLAEEMLADCVVSKVVVQAPLPKQKQMEEEDERKERENEK